MNLLTRGSSFIKKQDETGGERGLIKRGESAEVSLTPELIAIGGCTGARGKKRKKTEGRGA